MPWPMSIMMRAFTSQDDNEIKECIQMLMNTDAGPGVLHESFHKDNASPSPRPWFAWQTPLFGALLAKLVRAGQTDLLRSRSEENTSELPSTPLSRMPSSA